MFGAWKEMWSEQKKSAISKLFHNLLCEFCPHSHWCKELGFVIAWLFAPHPLMSKQPLIHFAAESGKGNVNFIHKLRVQIKKKNLDGPRPLAIICLLPDPHCFSFPTTCMCALAGRCYSFDFWATFKQLTFLPARNLLTEMEESVRKAAKQRRVKNVISQWGLSILEHKKVSSRCE